MKTKQPQGKAEKGARPGRKPLTAQAACKEIAAMIEAGEWEMGDAPIPRRFARILRIARRGSIAP